MPDDNEAATEPGAQPTPTGDHLGYARLLRRVDLFSGLDRITLAKLAAHLKPLAYASHATIFRQGDSGDAFYLIASGSVGVYTTATAGAGETRVKVLHEGEPFGEMALLTDNPRSASIMAETDCEVLRLSRGAFVDLVSEQPSVALAIAATLTRRLADMLGQPSGMSAADAAPATSHASQEAGPGAGTATIGAVRARKWPGRTVIALTAAIIIFALGWILPAPRGLSDAAWHGVFILLAILPPLVLDVLLEGVAALLLAGAWVLFGVTSTTDALSGFASTSWVLVVSVLILGAAIAQTGLLYRLTVTIISHMRGGFVGEAMALAFAGQLMGPAVPNATSRIVIIAPMLRELTHALGYAPKSKGAAGLTMAVLIGFGQMAATTLTSSTTAVLVAALLPASVRGDINWITWTIYAAPFNIILFVGLIGTILWYYRPAPGELPDPGERMRSLAMQRALLGPMSHEEKIALWVGIGLLAGFIAQPLHHIELGWLAAIAIGVLSAARLVTVSTLRSVNWNFALLCGVLISIATVFAHTGLDRWIADRVVGAIGNLPLARVVIVVVLTLFCFAVSFVVQAASPLVTIALAPAASAAGVHPFIVALIAVVACNGFFLPYQSTTYLALEAGTDRELFTRAQALPAAIAFGVWTVIAAVLSVPVWRMMGLM